MKLNKILGAAALLLALFSCENDPYRWEGATYARIVGPENWTLQTDSMEFTFARYSTEVTEYVVNAEINIIGKAADYDRDVVLTVVDSATTAESAMYSFETSVVIPAGEVVAPCDITLKRSAKLQDSTYRLKIAVTDEGEITSGVDEWNQLTIIFSDQLAKPTNWDEYLAPFFGEYSEVKYRFIISTTGVTEFTYGQEGGMTWGEMYNYSVTMANALEEYNATHDTPMTDENGKLVTF